MLICPVCRNKLIKNERAYICEKNHSFDMAKEGYVNLLTGKHKAGELIGDNRDMARARRTFLEKGYYDFLADELSKYISQDDKLLDISCGEGYYTDYMRRKTGADVSGFDISKEMIRLAAKKYKDVNFFVANIAKIPVKSESIDVAVQICAPFSEKEFARILKKEGILLSVVPGKRHLWGLKELLYENPYENNEDNTEYESLKKIDSITINTKVTLSGQEEIMSLFAMTPYYYKTSEKDRQKLENTDSLTTELEFVIRKFIISE
ncbi:MAG: methyltransferase domain-containing protein [Clostridia bacterium]|nr:methyltransferase domain-containing protein [Clostridia bacterium]